MDARHQDSCVQRMVAISPALNPESMSASAINALLYLCEVSVFPVEKAELGSRKNSRKVLKT